MPPIVESVPNVSEGRDLVFVSDACATVSAVPGVALLDVTADADHHRSVYTMAGAPQAVAEALMRLAELAAKRVDLRRHEGQHPRMGALDVAPFVPIAGISNVEAIALARGFAERLWAELRIPSFFYGLASNQGLRLEEIRRGGFEALLAVGARKPDFGGPAVHPSAGATAVGVRKPLIAWNVDLATTDPSPAKRIARAIRESSGGFEAVRALGLSLPSQNRTQVSMNLTDYERTPLSVVFKRIQELAAADGATIIDSELIGLIPRGALTADGGKGLLIRGFRPSMILENRIEQELGLTLP